MKFNKLIKVLNKEVNIKIEIFNNELSIDYIMNIIDGQIIDIEDNNLNIDFIEDCNEDFKIEIIK